MNYSDNEMSTIILCSYLGITQDYAAKPLSLGEWSSFYEKLVALNLEPSIVLKNNDNDLKNMGYDGAFIERIKRLVDRTVAISFELQELEKKGIKVVTEISRYYPIMLRRELKTKKPPVLFYAGNIELANKVGIGVVGSRNVSYEGMEFTKKLVMKASSERIIVYSGGAKGVDATSEEIALNSNNAVVSYIADSLTSKVKKTKIASFLADGKMLLFTDQKPDMGFTPARAMNRNKYIYASAMATFVVESDYDKGGTWTGASEALKNNWGRVFVQNNDLLGNKKLIEAGGMPYILNNTSIIEIIKNSKKEKKEEYVQMDLSSFI